MVSVIGWIRSIGGRLHNNNQFNGKVYVWWVERVRVRVCMCVFLLSCMHIRMHAFRPEHTEKDASMTPLCLSQQYCVLPCVPRSNHALYCQDVWHVCVCLCVCAHWLLFTVDESMLCYTAHTAPSQ